PAGERCRAARRRRRCRTWLALLRRLLRRLPARNRSLLRPRHGELARGRVLGDRRAGADVGALGDAHRRDQRRIRADEAAVLDHRFALVHAIVVAGDRARANVHAGADFRVADVGEMVHLRAFANTARLHLAEVADVDFFVEARARAQPRVGPDDAARADLGVV